ncbi:MULTISPECIES: carbonic anhydrase [Streptomyces]|uniref:carbonic anhydrase n=1 Tax=Streptomyces TaxID=1883 RepID=UPI00163BC3C0|nr:MULTISPECIES: carbonic anhydrase [Streptomyces]MBC2876054.1 carbonic anhydrase [Streptomyces sp. TYQ1024]UBI38414.1 carbonic anhydrase [Streptomyces mobaraensis]UKW30999.1 carbonic anhydrase [Streptomyces sp. TYQ1024]
MRSLIANARSFATHVSERADEFRALESGQRPEALFITCSDSRVVPSLITGARPGELFELRTAGNVVPPYSADRPTGETATIEYAVRVLGVRDIVVCGHSHCGAVRALVGGDDLSGVPAVRGWLERTAAWPGDGPAGTGGADLAGPAQRHAVAQLQRLRTHPCVAERISDGTVGLHAWSYEVHTGAVRELRSDGRFHVL